MVHRPTSNAAQGLNIPVYVSESVEVRLRADCVTKRHRRVFQRRVSRRAAADLQYDQGPGPDADPVWSPVLPERVWLQGCPGSVQPCRSAKGCIKRLGSIIITLRSSFKWHARLYSSMHVSISQQPLEQRWIFSRCLFQRLVEIKLRWNHYTEQHMDTIYVVHVI